MQLLIHAGVKVSLVNKRGPRYIALIVPMHPIMINLISFASKFVSPIVYNIDILDYMCASVREEYQYERGVYSVAFFMPCGPLALVDVVKLRGPWNMADDL